MTDNMVPEDEVSLTQTQTETTQEILSQNQEIDEREIWGRLIARQKFMKSVDLINDTFTLGRGSTCDYVALAPEIKEKLLLQVSKRHFMITRQLNDLNSPTYLQDLSRNGTFINEEEVGYNKKRILNHGDIISITHPRVKIFIYRDHTRNATELPDVISERYHLGRRLGSGACGTVYLVHHYKTCRSYALKHVKKNILIDCKTDKTANEASIMKSLEHPCIVRIFEIFDTPESVYFTLELMEGGELLSRIQKHTYLQENIAKFFFYQMCHAIKYLHDRNVTHRDLKPDNILLATTECYTLLKISDFGLSKLVRNNSVLKTLCGTPLYVAPEVLLTDGKGEYTEKVDIWSLGVVLFTCLSGTLPFADEYGSPATEQIKNGQYHFRSSNWKYATSSAKMVIRELLTTDVRRRPSINQLMQHRWLRDQKMIELAHNSMGIPYEAPEPLSDSEVFLRPYKVDVDSDNIQSSKRRRLRSI